MSTSGYPPKAQSQYSQQPSHYSHAGSTYAPSSTTMSIARSRAARPPPRFRPYMILIMILALGLVFIGLVMTIIAVWPGYTPVNGNPLKIAGPCLLGFGGLVFILGIVNTCWHSSKEKEKMYRQQQLLYAQSMSRSTINTGPVPVTPTSDARPSKSILKNAGSTSTYNGAAMTDGENTHSFSTNRSYERDSASDSGSAGLEGVRVSMNPDPTPQRGQRAQKTRSYAAANQGYSPEQEPEARQPPPNLRQQTTPPRQMQNYDGRGGYDMYDPNSVTGMASLSPASLVGAADMSPYRGDSYQQQQQQQPRRWGQPKQAATAAPSRGGMSNQAYETEYHQQSVSTVSHQYRDMTTPQRGTPTSYSTPQQRYQNAPSPAQLNTSTSTEV